MSPITFAQTPVHIQYGFGIPDDCLMGIMVIRAVAMMLVLYHRCLLGWLVIIIFQVAISYCVVARVFLCDCFDYSQCLLGFCHATLSGCYGVTVILHVVSR